MRNVYQMSITLPKINIQNLSFPYSFFPHAVDKYRIYLLVGNYILHASQKSATINCILYLRLHFGRSLAGYRCQLCLYM